jgi:two-component system sensor histidine kinase LytS
MIPRRTIIVDMLLLFAVTVLAVITAWVILISDAHRWLLGITLGGLTLVAGGSVLARWVQRPDHLKALQSDLILRIANESLSYMREGLTEETAGAVCRIILAESEVAAVAITDRECILGFAGTGESHHEVGGPVLTLATREAIDLNEHRILESRAEIGCPEAECLLRAAVVVPLEMRGSPVGTLKFYYTTPRLLNETQVAMAEGLAKLLSTQLELSELERQMELACRMELKALQAQINPHFLFNTINTIAMLIRTDPSQARELLREFAVFYRRTLEANEDLVPLEQELEYVRMYLNFEKARFGERIVVTEEVEPGAAQTLVPPFLIQPIVENSVQHGMRPEGPMRIALRGSLVAGSLRVTVSDDGAGIPVEVLPRVLEPGFGAGMGIALANVDDRLKGHFGPGSGLMIESVEGEGTQVTLMATPLTSGT